MGARLIRMACGTTALACVALVSASRPSAEPQAASARDLQAPVAGTNTSGTDAADHDQLRIELNYGYLTMDRAATRGRASSISTRIQWQVE